MCEAASRVCRFALAALIHHLNRNFMQNLVFCFIKLRSFCVVTSQVRCILWCHSWCRRSVQSLSYVSCSAAAARNRTRPLSNIQTQYFRDSPIFLSLLIYVILKVVSWSSITEYVLIQTSRDEGWITFQVYFYEGNNNNWTDISQTVVLNICWNQVGGKTSHLFSLTLPVFEGVWDSGAVKSSGGAELPFDLRPAAVWP